MTKPLPIRFLEMIFRLDYCNEVSMNYQQNGNQVVIKDGYSTLNKCPEMMPDEPTILKALK